jgi:hypothetical protein
MSTEEPGGKILTSNVDLHNLFDEITKQQNAIGETDYRCVYVYNSGNDVFASTEFYLTGDTSALIEIGIEGNSQTATLTGNGSLDTITLLEEDCSILSVKINNVITTAYTLTPGSPDTVVFDDPIPNGLVAEVKYYMKNVNRTVAQTLSPLEDTTAPENVEFFTPTNGSPMILNGTGIIPGLQHVILWIKRTANEEIGNGTIIDTIGLVVRGTQ